MGKFNELESRLKGEFPRVFMRQAYIKLLKDFALQEGISEYMYKRLLRRPKRQDLNWVVSPELSLLSFEKDVLPEEVTAAICKPGSKYFGSHYTAMYWHDLVMQKPEEYYISKEIPGRRAEKDQKYRQNLVRQAFMKKPRTKTQAFTYKKKNYYIVEREDIKRVGLDTVSLSLAKVKTTFQVSSIERTLIYSVMQPHYSGGIITVADAFRNAEIDLSFLHYIYKAYSPYYPYWQSIGFLLKKAKGKEYSSEWRSNFDIELREFYLDRSYRENWLFDREWQVHYPPGGF